MRIRYVSTTTGFTLIELVVVIAVLAIAAAVATFSIAAGRGHVLEAIAERLASNLESARWHAISTGRRVAWEAPWVEVSAAGGPAREARWYDQMINGSWQRRVPESDEMPQAGLSIRIAQPLGAQGAAARLVLGPEPVGVPACVLLTLEGAMIAVVSDGVTPFAVKRDGRC